MLGAAVRQIRAWWMGNQKIPLPARFEQFAGIAAEVKLAIILRGQQVATPGVVPVGAEGVAHNSGEFTSDQDPHATPFRFALLSVPYILVKGLIFKFWKFGAGAVRYVWLERPGGAGGVPGRQPGQLAPHPLPICA